jgi:membrane fusion protein, copper/silver efflux system
MCRYIIYRFIFLLCTSGLLVLAACNNKTPDNSQHQQDEKKGAKTKPVKEVKLESLIKPTNQFVVSGIPLTAIQKSEEQIEIEALGIVTYDTREVGTISARISGRIERLYVRYRYQKITKGQKILEIYSPEIQTAQQNLLFLLKNDPDNISLISAAKEKLLLLGMSEQQLQDVVRNNKTSFTITVYSNYSGHIHEAGSAAGMGTTASGVMKDVSLITEELPLKEGMYLQKGQAIFNVFNPAKAWALLNIYTQQQELVKTGNVVLIVPETAPDKNFRAVINFIEPFYRKDSKTLTARVYFDNASLQVPIGSQVRATIFGNTKDALWLPKESVVSLGLDKIVFLKEDGGFRAHKVITGITHEKHIQIINGLSMQDSIALNAQYLMDSESFIKVNQ